MDFNILYGSQTGNAEDMAKRIGKKAKSLGYKVLVSSMDDFDLKSIPKQHFVLFICSTTGHGQEPENMRLFYNFIRRRDLPRDCLSNLNYAVYGLGDSSYVKFNYVSKILFKRLNNCGAKPIQELVAGDEQHQFGCDGIIYPKLDELWPKVEHLDLCKSTENLSIGASYSIKFLSNNLNRTIDCGFSDEFISKFDIKSTVCTINRRITPESHFQDTRYLCFKSVTDIHYEPGDVCSILPANKDENVYEFIKLLGLDPEQQISIRKSDDNYMLNYLYDFIPDGLDIYQLVKFYLDIQSVPKRSFFEHLWPFGGNDLEKSKLQEFASLEGQEEVFEYCFRSKRSIVEVLMDFPHTVKNIKFDHIFDMIPPIKPRSFSIASCADVHKNEIHLIVGVVKYQTRLKKSREGLCSNYLANIQPGDCSKSEEINCVRLTIKKTSFKLPIDKSVPIILVGPGLGMAPFRSFLEYRYIVQAGHTNLESFYFGCRFKDVDFYFKDELDTYVSEYGLRLRVAFSREKPKVYVQDLMIEDGSLIKDLIENKNAVVYVAGNSKLPDELRIVLSKILNSELGDSSEKGIGKQIIQLETSNRIQYDCW